MIADARQFRRRVKRAALVHTKAVGCTCDPRFELGVLDDGQPVAVLAHRDHCKHLHDMRAAAGVERLPFPVGSGRMDFGGGS
jgi:hypothetical protein